MSRDFPTDDSMTEEAFADPTGGSAADDAAEGFPDEADEPDEGFPDEADESGAGDGVVLTPAEILDFIDERGSVADDAISQARCFDDIPQISEEIIGTERIWEGNFLKLDDVEVRLPDGRTAHRDIVRHPGAVAIIALDDENRVLLVNQYRSAIERVALEIPAGKLEGGEDAAECARRELWEETGYEAGKMVYLIPIHTAPGYSDEVIHLFMATDLKPGDAHPDADEFIVTQWMDLSELIDLVLDGGIEDSKTIIAALACDAMARRLAG